MIDQNMTDKLLEIITEVSDLKILAAENALRTDVLVKLEDTLWEAWDIMRMLNIGA